MISRYSLPEMEKLWSQEARFEKMLEVEKAVAASQAARGMIPRKAATEIQKKGRFTVKEIEEIEKTTRHDVIAFVSVVAQYVGDYGRFVHFGLTSSDVLDTAISLQIREAGDLLLSEMDDLEKAMEALVQRHQETLCAGRTHGMHAEVTSFGLKIAGFLEELKRNSVRLEAALDQAQTVKLSGAVGTSSGMPMEIEEDVARRLKMPVEKIATQVIPRDRHAEVLMMIALYGAGLERLAVELRHLQRTELGEVYEGFKKGQKGSSAMPHKRNPISAENITGLARLLRGYAWSALENVALWHERDISHSSVERVIFPDAFIVAHYATRRMTELLKNLEVQKDRMRQNMDISQGQLFSSHLLLALVEKGLSREAAYEIVQGMSHSLKPNEHLKSRCLKTQEVKEHLNKKEIEAIFSGKRHLEGIRKRLKARGRK